MLRMLMHLACLCSTLQCLIGCGCNQRVSVENLTDKSHTIRLATSYPSYEFGTDHCRFQFNLPAGSKWISTQAHSDRAEFGVVQPNGPLIIELCSWTECKMYECYMTRDDFASITINGVWPEVQMNAINNGGQSLTIEESSYQWFTE